VLSTCEELAYPFRKHPQIAAKLDAEAKTWGVALAGTGVNPGFVMDKLVLDLSAASRRVDSVRIMRIVNASTRREPLQRKVGAGLTQEAFQQQVAAGVIKHHGLPDSVAMVSDALGLAVDEITETIEPVIASAAVRTEYLEVAAGQAAGVRQVARGFASGREKIYMELQMYVGASEASDTIELRGDPDIRVVIPDGTPGDISTAGVVVNSIPAILDAPAGLRTPRDLPICFLSPSAKL
jgi:4-hydroxy-tetrahydrodipicolinate reductase